MRRLISTLIFVVMGITNHVQAQTEDSATQDSTIDSQVCARRPDLCEKSNSRTSTTRRRVKAPTKNGSYNRDLDEALVDMDQTVRRPAAQDHAPAATVHTTFEDYLTANASHPAISGKRIIAQEAFKDTSKAAVITIPSSLYTDPVTTSSPTSSSTSNTTPPASGGASPPPPTSSSSGPTN